MAKNWKKLQRKSVSIFFLPKIAIYLSLGLLNGCHCPSNRKGLQLTKENIQHFKIWNFLTFFYFYGVFAFLDPDPESDSGFGFGSTGLIRIHWPDSDPLAWLNPDPIREFGTESETLPERTRYPFTAMDNSFYYRHHYISTLEWQILNSFYYFLYVCDFGATG